MHIRSSNRFLPILLILVILVITVALSIPQSVNAQSDNKVVITLLWGDGCPHCAVERPFLKSLQTKYPNLEVRTYEVWYVDANIPIILGDKKWLGIQMAWEKKLKTPEKSVRSKPARSGKRCSDRR